MDVEPEITISPVLPWVIRHLNSKREAVGVG
jgi:hypothetical protein